MEVKLAAYLHRCCLCPHTYCEPGLSTSKVYPNVGKVGGLQSQGAKGDAVVNLLQTLANEGSGVLRLSRLVGS